MNFDLRYPFSQILTKPALSGTSLVRVGLDFEGKPICRCELHAANGKLFAVTCHLPKNLGNVYVKTLTDYCTLITFTVSIAISSYRSFGSV